MDLSVDEAQALIRRWFQVALAAVDPTRAVQRAITFESDAIIVGERVIPLKGRLFVIGFGKAAVSMALGAEQACGDRIAAGFVITKDGHAEGKRPSRIQVKEASHPIPDERGVRATREMLDLLSDALSGDVVLALISGGGSALLEAPRPPVTLDDVAKTTALLLKAGAPIQDLNRVRIPLSLVKGGGLRRAADEATMVTLILSDVLGNDTSIIASGPTVHSFATAKGALELIERYRIVDRVPATVRQVLEAESGQVQSWDYAHDVVEIVADNAIAVQAVEAEATAAGFRTETIWRAKEGEASDLGRDWIDACRSVDEHVDVLLGGGEATVTVNGDGIGGRNTEFALAAAMELGRLGETGWVVASLATDGQDGPTDVAGAIADGGTILRAKALGVSADQALVANDSLRVFDVAGGAVRTGPTGTNVNDLYSTLR